jgi:hypothetical protein
MATCKAQDMGGAPERWEAPPPQPKKNLLIFCPIFTRPVWQGLSTDSLKFYPGPLCPLPNPSTPCGQATPGTAVLGEARRYVWRPAAVFYPLGYPSPYVPAFDTLWPTVHDQARHERTRAPKRALHTGTRYAGFEGMVATGFGGIVATGEGSLA